jgi:hypothetical protein
MTNLSPGAGTNSRAKSAAESGVKISQTYVSFQVHDASYGGMSSSMERMGDTTVHMPDEAKASEAGLPSKLVLKPEAVAAIVAARLETALGREIHPTRITFDVSGSSGTGYSHSGPRLNCARLRFSIQA